MSAPGARESTRRRLAIALAALVAIWALLGVVIPTLVGGDRLRDALVRRAGAALGRPVTAERVSISVWTGPRLLVRGLEFLPPAGADPSDALTARVESGSVRLAILPLLRGAVEARSVRFDGVRVRSGPRTLASDLRGKGRIGRERSGAIRGAGHVEGILDALAGSRRAEADFEATLERGVLRIGSLDLSVGILRGSVAGTVKGIDEGAPVAALDGTFRVGATTAAGRMDVEWGGDAPKLRFELKSRFVDMDEILAMARRPKETASSSWGVVPLASAEPKGVARSWLRALEAEGSLEADGGRLQEVTLGPMRIAVRMRDGTLRAEEFTCRVHDGSARGEASVRVAEAGMPFRAEVRLDGVRMETLAAEISPERGRVLRGTGWMSLSLEGAAGQEPLAPSLRGSASLAVRDGTLTSVGLMKQAASFLELAGGKGIGSDETAFERMSANLDIGESRARTEDLQFRSSDLDLDGGGTVGFDGTLTLDVKAAFSKEASGAMVAKTSQLSFRVGPDGRLTVPMKIRGNLAAPVVQIDLERVLEEGLQQELRRRGEKGLLRKLLGR